MYFRSEEFRTPLIWAFTFSASATMVDSRPSEENGHRPRADQRHTPISSIAAEYARSASVTDAARSAVLRQEPLEKLQRRGVVRLTVTIASNLTKNRLEKRISRSGLTGRESCRDWS